MSTYIKVQGSAFLSNLKVATSADGGGALNGWDAASNTYYINNVATTLDQSGNGDWNGSYYEGGSLFTGYRGSNGIYYIAGAQTTLDYQGTGVWNGGYYLNGVGTTLDSNGDGLWNGLYYVGGGPATGYYNATYYIGGVDMVWLNEYGTGYHVSSSLYYVGGVSTAGALNSSGTGTWNSLYYEGGVPFNGEANGFFYVNGTKLTGWDGSGTYYIEGVATTLDQNGDGTWNGQLYMGGVLVNGIIGGVLPYYINGVQTTLNTSGQGIWYNNGSADFYIAGVKSNSTRAIVIQTGDSGNNVVSVIVNRPSEDDLTPLSHYSLTIENYMSDDDGYGNISYSPDHTSYSFNNFSSVGTTSNSTALLRSTTASSVTFNNTDGSGNAYEATLKNVVESGNHIVTHRLFGMSNSSSAVAYPNTLVSGGYSYMVVKQPLGFVEI